jgi:hypothetical protein
MDIQFSEDWRPTRDGLPTKKVTLVALGQVWDPSDAT